MYVYRDAEFLNTVARHQHTAIVFYHSLAVAINVVQWQHHSQSDRTLTYVVGLILYSFALLGSYYLECRIRNLQHGSFLQRVARLTHLRVGLHQLFYRDVIHP